jgi:hypothetical protein
MSRPKRCYKRLTLWEHTCPDSDHGMSGDEYEVYCSLDPGHEGAHQVSFTSSYDGFDDGMNGLDSWNPSHIEITWRKD